MKLYNKNIGLLWVILGGTAVCLAFLSSPKQPNIIHWATCNNGKWCEASDSSNLDKGAISDLFMESGTFVKWYIYEGKPSVLIYTKTNNLFSLVDKSFKPTRGIYFSWTVDKTNRELPWE